ncbi:D-alanyl-D-alanine carboxypeptidase [Coleofasciculus sp. E2-BRE-01]|uniref:D-alanyl-D-alanine carboxypeptidase n=1 Tax=Coleofasciculus sp. E2-BRE-01 TaxID=3069524 RepID=UPI003301CE20
MLKPLSLTTALSLTLLTFTAGCSPQSNPSQPSANENEIDSVSVADSPAEAELAQKPAIPSLASPDNPNPAIQAQIEQYMNGLAAKGFAQENHGIWIQAGDTLLANYQGTVPLPAASITKVATSLAALQTFGPDHQFITLIGATGAVENGVLQGDLVIEGGDDPFFVWEEAIALGNLLNQMGIQQVAGNLIITGKFYMNFEFDPLTSGTLLRQGLNSQLWTPAAQTQYQTLPPDTPKPQVAIAGSVQVSPTPPSNVQPLIRHYSFPLAELIKKMNQYSNNKMADMLANSVGGANVVAQQAAAAAGVPQAEITLVNGSGLSDQNKISPRAASGLFLAIARYLQPYNMSLGDILAVVGQDEGILNERPLPPFAIVKSGSLNNVSALGGALPTQQQGILWFSTMNRGYNLEGFRTQQEALLQSFMSQWGAVQSLPEPLQPNPERTSKTSSNEVLNPG